MEPLTAKEILTILRAADQIIAMGGRTQLVKILKGSKEKRVLELGLDANPAYGSFSTETMAEILEKVDWMIDYEFFDLHFQGKLPTIVFTDRGWAWNPISVPMNFCRNGSSGCPIINLNLTWVT